MYLGGTRSLQHSMTASLPPGLLALVVLPVSALLGWLFAVYKVRKLGGLQHLGQLAVDSIVTCVVCAVFWVWASYNLLVLKKADLGVVSFLIAFVAAYRTADLSAVQIRRAGRLKDPAPVRSMRWLHPAALLVVATNYAAALLLDLPPMFRFYLCVGAAYWTLASYRSYRLLADDRLDRSAEQQELYRPDEAGV